MLSTDYYLNVGGKKLKRFADCSFFLFHRIHADDWMIILIVDEQRGKTPREEEELVVIENWLTGLVIVGHI